MWRSRGRAILVALALALVFAVAARAQDHFSEEEVKAAYLSKFGAFVEWPPSAFDSSTSPLNVCVIGETPLTDALEIATRGQKIKDRPIAVRPLNDVRHDSGCHILYIQDRDPRRVSRVVNLFRGDSVLTVTDDATDFADNVIVTFVTQNNHLRFAINQRAATANKLTISSRLLDLAVSVRH